MTKVFLVSFEVFVLVWLSIPFFWDMLLYHWVTDNFQEEFLNTLTL
jgi:hypothetical protein